jgi:septal ring factor EnvC (AmiA/AmiB activator)
MYRALHDMRSECSRKETQLQKSLTAIKEEHRNSTQTVLSAEKERSKLQRELDRIAEKEKASEKERKEVSIKLH